VRTTLGPEALLWLLQRIETRFGRDRANEVPNGPRTLDLDLLLFGARAVESPTLVLPHPRMEERTFVLEPLCALAPDLELPRSRTTVRARLEELRAAEAGA
jgi:2-amino-4-hydroxy-6-hydroxymethyldihydropteridine diphosphokinase